MHSSHSWSPTEATQPKKKQIEINRAKNGTVPRGCHQTIAFAKTFPFKVTGEKLKGLA